MYAHHARHVVVLGIRHTSIDRFIFEAHTQQKRTCSDRNEQSIFACLVCKGEMEMEMLPIVLLLI